MKDVTPNPILAKAREPQVEVKLPQASATDPFVTGDYVLKAIMDKFVELREGGKTSAWRQLQTDLMKAAPFLIPHIITLDKVIDIAATIEKEIKGSTAQVGRSNEELLADFLNGGDAIPLDRDATIQIKDGEAQSTISPPEVVSPTPNDPLSHPLA